MGGGGGGGGSVFIFHSLPAVLSLRWSLRENIQTLSVEIILKITFSHWFKGLNDIYCNDVILIGDLYRKKVIALPGC